jgi:hypothetical protein
LPANDNRAGDTLFYAPSRGTNISQQRFSLENEYAATQGASAGTLGTTSFDTNITTTLANQVHVALTFIKDADGGGPSTQSRFTLFINGAQVNTALGNQQLENLNDVNAWLGKSNYPADSQFFGTLDEFRIYDHGYTPSEAGRDFLLGPNRTGEILKLVVNTSTGATKIVNEQGDLDISYDYYKITSASGALNETGWSSLDEQEGGDPLGTGWDESIGGTDDNQLTEFFLGAGGEMFLGGGEQGLGNAFDIGGDEDLVFEYGGPSGFLIQGAVEYEVIPPMDGDYNEDGQINAADYTVYRNHRSGIVALCGADLDCANMPNDSTPGSVTLADYTFWKGAYGTGSGASVGGGDVPEPATLVSFVFGLLVAGVSASRRRK